MALHTEAAPNPDSIAVSVSFFTCAVCRSNLAANAKQEQSEVQVSTDERQTDLTKITTHLYLELRAASAVIAEMTNNMTAAQKRVASTNLYEAGFMGRSGGMTRASERLQALAAAEAAGIK